MKQRHLLVLPFVLAACAPDAITRPPAGNEPRAEVAFAFSTDPCTFTTVGSMMFLNGDCSTSASIVIPDGFTLNGQSYTITAVDPGPGLPFLGAVIRNGGSTAHVTLVHVRTLALSNVCHGGGAPDNRLRGIMFEGASGSITHSSIVGVNQGPSGCQEGNAVEVRNAPFDGTYPNTQTVEIAHNVVADYQKTGVVCNGDVNCSIHHNDIGASATQANLAANSIQLGFGGIGSVMLNKITGNSWCGPSDFVATALLLFASGPGTVIESNRIDGNSDVGIYAFADGVTIAKNTVEDVGTDCNAFLYDYGIGDYGASYPDPSNSLTKNKVSGFDTPYDPEAGGGKNQVKKPKGGPAAF